MNTSHSSPGVRPSDRRGHRDRRSLLELYHQSNLTQRQFASRHGIGLSTLALWLRQERQNKLPSAAFPEPQLVEVSLASRPPGGRCFPPPPLHQESPRYEIEVGEHLRLRMEGGFELEQARQLLDLLVQHAGCAHSAAR